MRPTTVSPIMLFGTVAIPTKQLDIIALVLQQGIVETCSDRTMRITIFLTVIVDMVES